MVAKDHKKTKGLNKAEVGEIDTSAPFQSVKDAVNLFGEGAFSGEKPAIRKPKPQSAERVLAKETQLHLVQKELNKLNERLKYAETTKSEALVELEIAKRTVEELTQKLKAVIESKDSAVKATEAAKHQAKLLSQVNNGSSDIDPESHRIDYMTAATQLDAAKQELRKIRQEYDASMEAKNSAAEQAAEAEKAAQINMERVDELSKEISALHDSVQEVELASVKAREEEITTCAEKEKQKQLYKSKLEELVKKLLVLRKEVEPELTMNLETQLRETLSEIEAVKEEIENKRAKDLDSVKRVTSELDDAKESLVKVAEEENSLRSLIETLKLDLDKTKKEHIELKQKEAEIESVAGNLHVKLRKAKSELEEAIAEEAKARGASDEMIATLRQLALENQNAKCEAKEMKLKIEDLRKEAEAARIELEEAEKKLSIAMQEVEEANAAEAKALSQIQMLSEKTDTARASTSEIGAHITISKEEYESLSRKAEESEKLAEMKVAAAMAQVEALKASENEAMKRLEATQKEIEDMKAATTEALRKAEMSEAAKKAIEGELRRWREREQKKAAEAASRILAETRTSFESSSPVNYRIQKQKPPEKTMETRDLAKAKTKKVLLPSLSGFLHKNKNQVESNSPSYLSGAEKPSWS